MPSRSLGFAGQAIVRVNAEHDVLGWLAELVEPALRVPDESGEWEVDVLEWRERPLARPSSAEAVRSLACFVLDRSTLQLPAWRGESGLVVCDAERGCVFTIRAGRITLAPHGRRGRRWRYTLALLVYELVAARARRDQLELHSAAVQSGGRGVLALGPKQAGKTTTALHLQRRGGCRAIANDRVFVGPGTDPLTVRGLPTVVKIRPETVMGLPEFQTGRPWLERPYLYSVAELSRAQGTWPGDEELSLTSAQVAARLGGAGAAEAPIDVLMFPSVDVAAHGVAAARLPAEAVRTLIGQNLFGQRDRPRVVFEDLDESPRVATAPLLEALSRVPAYRVTLGADAHTDPDFSQRILSAIGMT